MSRRTAAILALVVVIGAVGGCSTPDAVPTPGPTAPPDWSWTTSGRGDLRIALPPWLVAFETSGAIFANEVRADGQQGLQIMAEGPDTAEPQLGSAGGDLTRWLGLKVGAGPGSSTPTMRWLDLDAGRALVMERLDRPGTATAWRLTAYAIATRTGMAFLLIDGPSGSWTGREDDMALIARLLKVQP